MATSGATSTHKQKTEVPISARQNGVSGSVPCCMRLVKGTATKSISPDASIDPSQARWDLWFVRFSKPGNPDMEQICLCPADAELFRSAPNHFSFAGVINCSHGPSRARVRAMAIPMNCSTARKMPPNFT